MHIKSEKHIVLWLSFIYSSLHKFSLFQIGNIRIILATVDYGAVINTWLKLSLRTPCKLISILNWWEKNCFSLLPVCYFDIKKIASFVILPSLFVYIFVYTGMLRPRLWSTPTARERTCLGRTSRQTTCKSSGCSVNFFKENLPNEGCCGKINDLCIWPRPNEFLWNHRKMWPCFRCVLCHMW